MRYNSASGIFAALDGLRTSFLTRVERYAALTIPKVLLPKGINHEATDQAHDYQSIGAQATNHVVNKLMLALFAPSRPFIKLVVGKKTKAQLAKLRMTETQLDAVLAQGERDAVKELDVRAQRPKLYQLLRHLVVAGNALLYLAKDGMRVIGLRNFVVKRNIKGDVLCLVICEKVNFDELEPAIVKLLQARFTDDTQVNFYKWIKRESNGSYSMTQWVNEIRLPIEYDGRWPEEKLPYRVLTWDLSDEANYGTGLVEEYIGDFEALSSLSESVVDGAILGSEYRWMVNPTGMTSIEDVKASQNGDALPGLPTDMSPTQGGNPEAIKVAMGVLEGYERRVSRGFLMGSAVIRDAERVTQEEVRLTANELETAYGGVYSTLAAGLQLPVALWLFDRIGQPIAGSDLRVTVVTGLDALSRNGDLENFRLAMSDMATLENVPETLRAKLKMEEIAAFVGQGRGIDLLRFVMTDAEFAATQQEAAANRVAETVTTEAGVSAAQGA
jgi:hypothetical protein